MPQIRKILKFKSLIFFFLRPTADQQSGDFVPRSRWRNQAIENGGARFGGIEGVRISANSPWGGAAQSGKRKAEGQPGNIGFVNILFGKEG